MRLSDQHVDISRLLTILGKLVAVRAIEGFPIESQPLVLVKHTNKPRIKNPNYNEKVYLRMNYQKRLAFQRPH